MVNLNFTWKKKTGQYQQGEALYVNKIRLAGYDYNISRSQSDTSEDIKWAGGIELPSLSDTSKRVYGGTPEEIKTKIEQVVTSWFNEVLKEATQ